MSSAGRLPTTTPAGVLRGSGKPELRSAGHQREGLALLLGCCCALDGSEGGKAHKGKKQSRSTTMTTEHHHRRAHRSRRILIAS